MDRDKIVELSKKHPAFIDPSDLLYTVVQYCADKGKNYDLSVQFALTLSTKGNIIPYFMESLEYFQIKFNVCTLTDINGQLVKIF